MIPKNILFRIVKKLCKRIPLFSKSLLQLKKKTRGLMTNQSLIQLKASPNCRNRKSSTDVQILSPWLDTANTIDTNNTESTSHLKIPILENWLLMGK